MTSIHVLNSRINCWIIIEGGGFPDGSGVKNPPANARDTGDPGLISGLGRSPGGGNSNPLQYSCLENPMDRGARWTRVHGVATSCTQLSTAAAEQKTGWELSWWEGEINEKRHIKTSGVLEVSCLPAWLVNAQVYNVWLFIKLDIHVYTLLDRFHIFWFKRLQ